LIQIIPGRRTEFRLRQIDNAELDIRHSRVSRGGSKWKRVGAAEDGKTFKIMAK